MKHRYKTPIKTVVIAEHVHANMVSHLEKTGVSICRFVEKAIEAQIESEKRVARILEKVTSAI